MKPGGAGRVAAEMRNCAACKSGLGVIRIRSVKLWWHFVWPSRDDRARSRHGGVNMSRKSRLKAIQSRGAALLGE
jgi:hypothetical protein